MRSRSGFALVELLTVLIVIAILVAIAVPLYNSTQQTARDRADEANVRILNSATLQWMLADEANDPRGEGVDAVFLETELKGNYVMEWPVSPNDKTYKLDEVQGYWIVE